MQTRTGRATRLLGRDDSGNVAVMTGVLMTALVGFVGLGIEVGLWWHEKSQTQSAADAAAFAGGYELLEGQSEAAVVSAGDTAARDNGYDSGAADVDVAITATSDSVTAKVRSRLQPMFVSLLLSDAVEVNSKATVLAKRAPRNTCLLALDPDDSKALNIRGDSDITLENCGAHANSSHSQGLCADGNNTRIRSDIGYGVVGGTGGDCNKHDNFKTEDGSASKPPETGANVLDDPYADVSVVPPSIPADCTANNLELHDGDTLADGGVYCGNLSIKGTVHLPSNSVFYIAGGRLDITSTYANVTGSNVTFVLTDGAYVTVDGGTVNLSAPTSGTLQGLLFYQDPATTPASTPKSSFVGDASSIFNGALYFPNTEVYMSGTQNSGATCTQVIGGRLDIAGAFDFLMSYDPASCAHLKQPTVTILALVE